MIFHDNEFGIIYTIMDNGKAKSGRAHAGILSVENNLIDFTIPWWLEFIDGKAIVAEKPINAKARFEVMDNSLA